MGGRFAKSRLRESLRGIVRGNSVFRMVLLLFFAITIPIYAMGYGLFRWGYAISERRISEGLTTELDYHVRMLEGELLRIQTLEFECLNDEDLFYNVNASPFMTPFDRTRALLTMQHRLSVMQQASSYIRDVQVYLTAADRMVSASDGVMPMTDEWKEILASPAVSDVQLRYVGNRVYMCASYPLNIISEKAEPLYTMVISLRTEAFRELLQAANSSASGGTALGCAQSGFFLSDGGAGEMLRPLIMEDNADPIGELGHALWRVDGKTCLLAARASGTLGMQFYGYAPRDSMFGDLDQYTRLWMLFLLGTLALALAYAVATYYLVRRPMRMLVDSLSRLEKGELDVRISHSINDEYAYVYDTFNGMAAALQNLIDMNLRQELLTQQAQMKQLQAQINPHFLYNSFYTLQRMAKDEDLEGLEEFLHYLAEYFRFITRDGRDLVSLGAEVAHATNYAHIQAIRFRRRIRVELEALPEDCASLQVPRLILQPVLENAFEHGLKDVLGDGFLCLSYRREAEWLYIQVANNGADVSGETLAALREELANAAQRDGGPEVTGLVNIHRRLRIAFGEGSGVRLEGNPGGGLIVTLVLPGTAGSATQSVEGG